MRKVCLLYNVRARRVVLLASGLFIVGVRLFPQAAEWYARHIYPTISFLLSFVSGMFPFSIGDCFIYGSALGLLAYLLYSLRRRMLIWKGLCVILEYLAWGYVWFYLAWGLNYFREDFYTRSKTTYVAYEPERFKSFLVAYTDSLNAAYVPFERIDSSEVASEVKKGYHRIAERFGLNRPCERLRPKVMLFTLLMSKVGVLGYMGPFTGEFHLNGELLPIQYPSVYAHEMAHLLGIAGEAEANLYSYLVCTASDVPEIRFAGYFSLFPYLLGNAYRLLTNDEFEDWKETISPEIKLLYNDKVIYWQSRYSPLIGDLQDRVYHWFLKGNNIPTGRQNYSEVIGLVMALDQNAIVHSK